MKFDDVCKNIRRTIEVRLTTWDSEWYEGQVTGADISGRGRNRVVVNYRKACCDGECDQRHVVEISEADCDECIRRPPIGRVLTADEVEAEIQARWEMPLGNILDNVTIPRATYENLCRTAAEATRPIANAELTASYVAEIDKIKNAVWEDPRGRGVNEIIHTIKSERDYTRKIQDVLNGPAGVRYELQAALTRIAILEAKPRTAETPAPLTWTEDRLALETAMSELSRQLAEARLEINTIQAARDKDIVRARLRIAAWRTNNRERNEQLAACERKLIGYSRTIDALNENLRDASGRLAMVDIERAREREALDKRLTEAHAHFRAIAESIGMLAITIEGTIDEHWPEWTDVVRNIQERDGTWVRDRMHAMKVERDEAQAECHRLRQRAVAFGESFK